MARLKRLARLRIFLWPESISSPQSSACWPLSQKSCPNSVQSECMRPPMRLDDSYTSAYTPLSCSMSAAWRPAMPPPMMATRAFVPPRRCVGVLGEVRGAGHYAGAGDAGPLQELAAIVRGDLGSPLMQLGDRNPQPVGFAVVVREPPQGTEKRCPRHGAQHLRFAARSQDH